MKYLIVLGPGALILTVTFLVHLIRNPREVRDFFMETVPDFLNELSFAKYKVVNKNEGLRPFHLYRKTFPWGWVWQDSYREFEHARDDITAIRNRWQRGFRVTTTYYTKNGDNLHDN